MTPLMKGDDPLVISENIQSLVGGGMSMKDAVAKAISFSKGEKAEPDVDDQSA